eukprot:gene11574-12767_t
MLEIISGPGSWMGYRSMWHRLELEGIRVPRSVVSIILREVDPEGSDLRKRHKLKRRKCNNPGPNFAWHIDGYDKLKPWGFPIHGGIDGFSRRMLWLNVTRSNSSPDNIALMFLRTVEENKGCPVELVTDLGTENGIAAAIQSFFRDNPDAHRYVPSPRNQRIEGWWSYFSKHCSRWWINFFNDLQSRGIIDISLELSKECSWFSFSNLIQRHLNMVVEHWNTHTIQKSRFNVTPGRPDSLFYLPERFGCQNQLVPVPQRELIHASQHIVEQDGLNEYQEYFDMVKGTLGINDPSNWQEGLHLYKTLMDVANNGYNRP